MRTRALPGLALFVATAAGLGCAHAPRKMTFEEAGIDAEAMEPDAPPPPPVKVPAPRRVATQAPAGPPIDPELLRFQLEERARRYHTAAGHGFPDEAVQAWQDLDKDLDAYLGRGLPQTPLIELVRARTTVEVELEYDQRRYGPAPSALVADVYARLARLANRVAASRALGGTLLARRRPPQLHWPIDSPVLSSPFGMRFHPIDHVRKMHYGIDLAAERGRVVFAAAKGIVVHAGWMGGYGLMVEVRHEGDLTTRYSHLSKLLCEPGDAVEPGRALGLVGSTGKSTGPHLHFEVWRGGTPKDPLVLLGGDQPATGAAGN